MLPRSCKLKFLLSTIIIKRWRDNYRPNFHNFSWYGSHLTRPSERTSAAIRLAFAMMELDDLPTDQDMDLTTLRVYVRQALGPRTQDADPDLFDFNGQVPDFPHDL